MELFDGNLQDILHFKGRLGEDFARQVFHKIVKAVNYSHSQGVIHHDLKTQNVLINVNDAMDITKIKLADFGLHRQVTETLTAFVDTNCTIEYAAPEMFIEGH